jgi:hypothetical protein
MDRRMAWALLGITLALTGCAKVSGAAQVGTQSTPSPLRPVSVGADQSGGTLMIHIGQELIVQLGSSFRVPQSTLPSVHYPTDLLSFTSKGTPSGTYVFEGRAQGAGQIWIVEPGCAPGPALRAGALPANCPLVGPASSQGGGPGSWMFTATVRVVPSGL